MNDGLLLSVRTGRVRTLSRPEWDHSPTRTWNTAYLKEEVDGAIRVSALGLEGDEVFSTDVHGGPQMAVLAYGAGHYPAWQEELDLPEMGPGGFGENLTIEGQDEQVVCIGDIYAAGEVQLQVSQPRGPCASISLRWGLPTLLKRVSETNRTGWYLRVLREGRLERGQSVRRMDCLHPEWPIDRLLTLRHHPQLDPAGVRWLSTCKALSPEWQEMYATKAAQLP